MGRFEDHLLKGLGLPPDAVTNAHRTAANEVRKEWRARGDSLVMQGCGITIAALLVIILFALL